MTLRDAGRALVRLALSALAPGRVVVVHGWGDGEENALRLIGALSVELPPADRLVMLCEHPAEARAFLESALREVKWSPGRVRRVRKNSLRGLVAFLRARVVFSTHGLFGNPSPGDARLHVLLGHGHGPKSASGPHRSLTHRAQLATTNNREWGLAVIRDQGIGDAGARVTGNPRDDVFGEYVDRDRLAQLGVDPDRPLLLWLPTYRVPRNDPASADLREVSADARLQERLGTLHREAAAMGITVLTKAHQLDDQRNAARWGFLSVDADSLRGAGLSFFQLLALADGLVSDYSSVWVDYLQLARPTGLLFVDEVEYARGRGFNSPSIAEVASELVVQSDDRIRDLLSRVRRRFEGDGTPDATSKAVAQRLGVRVERGATTRVLDATDAWLDARGAPRITRGR